MGIEDAIRDATSASRARSATFDQQLRTNQQFSTKMQDAGVVPRKRGFTIPLMERIVVRA